MPPGDELQAASPASSARVRYTGAVVAAVAVGLLVYATASRLSSVSPAPVREGTAAPPLRLSDVAGQSATLAQYKGGVILLDFWATWCDSCVTELPELRLLHEKYRAKGFQILAASVDADGRKALLPFIAQHSIPWRVLVADQETTRAYRVFGLPAKFLIDPKGQVARRYDGPVDPRILESDIRRLLGMPAEGET